MIAFWNRKEVLSTYDTPLQAKARTILAGEGIPYQVKLKGLASMDRGGIPDLPVQMVIYVKKQDYDRACGALSKALHR